MDNIFSDRMGNIKKSFIREILKVAVNPNVISFAGGLPNAALFPVDGIKKAAYDVLDEDGASVLQYSTTEGFLPLREYIAERYNKKGINTNSDEILITNGSQQGLDLIGKVFINDGDKLLIEEPGYLGAIQAFSVFQPEFVTIPLLDDGADINALSCVLNGNDIKLFYTVPNFQNPSGISYSISRRNETAALLSKYNTVLVEDDPYGDLRFSGEAFPYISSFYSGNTILLGSFSKIIAPGLRMGWIRAGNEIMDKLITVKQGADLHSNSLSQRVIHRFLQENDIDTHIEKIKTAYGHQRDVMLHEIDDKFPNGIKCTRPEGGMFLWITLPDNIKSLEFFECCAAENVVFVPGEPFYTDGRTSNTIRMNFSNSDPETIKKGITKMATVLKKML